MKFNEVIIFFTGEPVPQSGMYEVVGVKREARPTTGELALRALQSGERFPTYHGHEVNWHYLESVVDEHPNLIAQH